MRSLWALCLSLIVVLAAASGAAAAPSIVEFPLPATGRIPRDLAKGADGNLWVSREGAINRVTPGGFATQFPLPDPQAQAQGIAASKAAIPRGGLGSGRGNWVAKPPRVRG